MKQQLEILISIVLLTLVTLFQEILCDDKCLSTSASCSTSATREAETCCLASKQFGEKKLSRCGIVTLVGGRQESQCCLIPYKGDHALNYCSNVTEAGESARPCCEERGEICSPYPKESLAFCCLPAGSKGPCDYVAPEGGCCPGLVCNDKRICVQQAKKSGRGIGFRKWREEADDKELPVYNPSISVTRNSVDVAP